MSSKVDLWIALLDKSLRVVTGVATASRLNPAKSIGASRCENKVLDENERRHSAALMRVNHVGEVCAQALYQSQGLFSQNNELKQQFLQAGREEEDHLAWTASRVHELGSHLSLLNPLWYAGAFSIGYAAAKLGGDRMSLGFVVETERQVEAHLDNHLGLLPANDGPSRAIVAQMKVDEAQHAKEAQLAGAAELPAPFKTMMQLAAKVMTTVAHRI